MSDVERWAKDQAIGAALDFVWPPQFATQPLRAWTHRGVLCAVAHGGMSINGYVCIPPDHPWRALTSYDDLPVSVHGGLTWGPERVSEPITWEDVTLPAHPGKTWDEVRGWVGFDTGHGGDWWSDEALAEAGVVLDERMRRSRELIGKLGSAFGRRIDWTLPLLMEETTRLADQVADAWGRA